MFPRSSEIKPLFRGSVRFFFLLFFFSFSFYFFYFLFFFPFVYRGTVGPPWTCAFFFFFSPFSLFIEEPWVLLGLVCFFFLFPFVL